MKKRVIAIIVSLVIAASSIGAAPAWAAETTEAVPDETTMNGEKLGTAAKVSGLDADVHSQSEIRLFVRNHLAPIIRNTYDEEPSTEAPYNPGKLSDRSTEAGFNALNQARYIAGIPADVEYDADYTARAQAGALLNAVNNKLDHYPDQPADMSDELYDLGYSGTSSSNLARGPVSLASSIILWMSDSDSYNISAVGHRRWILEPSMKKAGFGAVEGFSAVYVRDESRGQTSYDRIAWPAQNMPLEFWHDNDAWHVTFGSYDPINDIVVTLTRKGDGRKWTFSEDSADGYFHFQAAGYFGGYVIFRPDSISYSSGDAFDVTISGADGTTIAYTVNFFSICEGNHSYTSETISDPTCTAQGETVKTCENCGKVTYEYAPALGHNFIEVGRYDGLIILECDRCGQQKTASAPASFAPYWRKEGAEGSYWSYVPSGLEAGDGLEYMIYIDSYTAQASEHLSDMTVETSDPENCVLEDHATTTGTIRFLKVGTYTITIYPAYNPDVKVTKSVKIVKPLEAVTVLADPASPKPYGTSVRLEARPDGGRGTLKYTFVAVDPNGTESKLTSDASGASYTWKPAGTGKYKLRADVKDTGDNNRVVSSNILTYTVQQQPVKVKDGKTIAAAGALTYGQPLSALQVTNAVFVGNLDGTVQAGTFAFENPDEILAAGTHTVNWTFTPGNTNYAKKSGSLSVEVEKAQQPSEMPPAALSVSNSTDKLSNDILRTAGIMNWSFAEESIGVALTAGETVTFTVNYTGSDRGNYVTETAEVKVTRSTGDSIADASISGVVNRNYTGKAVTLAIEVKYGDKTLTEGIDYTVSYQNNIDPGTASVTIRGIGSYEGEVVREFYVLPGKTKRGDMFNLASSVKVTWEPVAGAKYYKVYREGVTDQSESLDEPVIVTKRLIGWDKQPGLTNGHAYRYKIVASLTDADDSSGDSKLSYSKLMYRLKTVAIRSAKNSAPGKVTVKYDKTTSGDGYVLRYCEREDMVGARTKAVPGASNTSYVISGLKKGKTYYISIRVRKIVDGINYYTTYGVPRKVTISQ